MAGSLGGLSGAAGGATQTMVAMDPSSAYTAAANAIRNASGTEKYAQPPASISFEIVRRSLLATGGVAIRYDGLLQIAPLSAHQSAVRVQVKPVPGTLTPLFFIGAMVSLMMMFLWYATMNLGLFGLLLGIVATAAQFYTLGTTAPREMAEKIAKELANSPARMSASPSMAPPSPPAPSPLPAPVPTLSPVPPPLPMSPPVANGAPATVGVAPSTMIEQLSQLAKLRDAGVLTPEEFERAKHSLLSRL